MRLALVRACLSVCLPDHDCVIKSKEIQYRLGIAMRELLCVNFLELYPR